MKLTLLIILFPMMLISQQYTLNCPVQFHTLETGIDTDTTYQVSIKVSGSCDIYRVEAPMENIDVTGNGDFVFDFKKQRGKVLIKVTNTCDNTVTQKTIISKNWEDELFGSSPMPLTGYVVLIGNSIISGATESSTTNVFPFGWLPNYIDINDWSEYLADDYGVRVYNMGWGGQTSAQILARFGRDALGQTVNVGDGLPDTTIGSVQNNLPSLIWLQVGINDINTGVTVPVIKSNIESIVSQADALGVKVMINNIGATEIFSNSSLGTDRIYELNCWLHSGYLQNKYDVIVKNYNAWSRGFSCNDSDVYNQYYTDLVHPNTIGYKYFYEKRIKAKF